MEFYERDLTNETLWRAIILFGRNVATFKFALGQALLSLAREGKSSATLEELAPHYAKSLCRHLAETPKQGTFGASKFIVTCRTS